MGEIVEQLESRPDFKAFLFPNMIGSYREVSYYI